MSSLSISKAWDESVEFIKREVRLIFPLALAFFMLPSVIMGWAQPGGAGQEGGLGLVSTLLLMILVMTGQLAIARLALGWDGSVGGAISRAAKRVWTYLAALIIVYFPLAIVGVLIIASVMGASGLTDPTQITPERLAAMPSVSIAVLVMMLAAVALAARLMPMSAASVAEDHGPIKLIRRAWTISRGHFWRLAAVMVLVGIASLTIDWAAQAVGGTLATLSLGAPAPFNFSALLVALLKGFVTSAASAVVAILTARIFAQLATRPHVPDVEA